MKNNFLLKYLLISFIYLELAFKLILGLNLLDISTFFVCLCAIIFVTTLCLIIDFFKHTGKTIIASVLLGAFAVYFSAHTCLYNFYKFYFQFSSLSLLDQAAAFASDGLKVILNNGLYILVYFLPLLAFVLFFRKYVDDKRSNIKLSAILMGYSLLFYLPFALDPYGYVNKTFASNNMIQIVNKNGVISGLLYDLSNTITGNKSTFEVIEEVQEDVPEIIKYDYNQLDIDFESLNSKTSNVDIIRLNDYFANKTPTKQNEYTSYFKDKNLILFMAESFNGICINEELTPTLYKLINGGFSFKNFYTPTIYSTIGGEYSELTGLYPDLDALSYFREGSRQYPMGIGNLFKQKGYTTYAYHNSTYDFQDRNTYLQSLGFDNYNACGLGLEKEIDCGHWPASDVDMINATFDDYINNDKFLVFYASVSGHGPYVFDSKENQIGLKYEEQLRAYFGSSLGDKKYADALMAYVGGQMELDRALETLINKLQAAGKLDDTVIALVGDHHPYYLTDLMSINDYNKLSTFERDEYIELYHSNFILYNSAMDTVQIDKVGGQLDVMPTIYNLFGMNYDSRLLMGVDLLSSSTSLVIMGDDSWVTSRGKYFANKGEFVSSDGVDLGDSYIDLMNKKVKNTENVSLSMIKNNYYKFVFDNK